MSRSMIFGLALGAATALASTASAAPVVQFAPNGASPVAMQIQYYGYGCPPGYKITSYGGCKLSHYLRRHPYQMPGYYGYRRQYDSYYYNDQPRYYRRYYRPYQGDDDYYGDD
ncbi:hypothetical protein ACN6KF_005548 [Labrys sp. La1]|uniref:hypothetical protein n=1 Tax=Labrys sp. La1 TaxID=3404917 RepID=UPI003EBB60BB